MTCRIYYYVPLGENNLCPLDIECKECDHKCCLTRHYKARIKRIEVMK